MYIHTHIYKYIYTHTHICKSIYLSINVIIYLYIVIVMKYVSLKNFSYNFLNSFQYFTILI